MSQESVYNFLKKKRRWLTSSEIAKAIHVNQSNVLNSLNCLLKYNEVKKKQIKTKSNNKYLWKAI